jgi:transposase
MRPVVGIDAHKESCTYVVRHWNKTLAGPTRIPSTRAALTKLVKQYPDHDFVLEVCAVHEWMMDHLRDQGANALAVIPPKKGPTGKKSDDDDATRLAKKHQAGELVEVYIGPPELRKIRDTIRQHEFLKTRWVGLNNNLKSSLLRWNFQPTKMRGKNKKPDVYSVEGRRQVLEAFPYLTGIYAVIDVVDDQMKVLKKQIEAIGKDIPEVQLLQSIPGIGPIISLALYVEIGTIDRFEKAEGLVRYFGLDPVHGSSGDKHWDGHRISKVGVSYVRGLLAQGCWSHISCCPDSDIAQNYHRLVRRGKTKQQALMTVARRLVKCVFWMLKEKREFTINGPARSAICRTSGPTRGAALTSVERGAPAAVRRIQPLAGTQ